MRKPDTIKSTINCASRTALAISALTVSVAVSQVPPGWAAYSRLHAPQVGSTLGGVTVFDPWGPGGFVNVTGLPAALVAAAIGPTALGGANCILVRDSDGSIVVGSLDENPGAIYDIELNGSAVAATRTFTIGLSWVDQMAWLPGNRILLATRLPSRRLTILDLTTGALNPVSVAPFPAGTLNAVAVDASGQTAYMGLFQASGSTVWTVPLPGGGAPTLVGNLPDGIYQLAMHPSGMLYASTFGTGLYVIDPTTGGFTNPLAVTQLNAMSIDPVTGDVLTGSIPGSCGSAMYRWSMAAGATLVAGMPCDDAASGLAVRTSMRSVGSQTGGAAPYVWQTALNPGGGPLLGNAGFSVTQRTSANPSGSALWISGSLLPSPLSVLGISVLVDPAQLIVVSLPAAAAVTVPLPVPNNPALRARSIYAQTFHLDATGLVSSPALCTTFL